jgi:3-oxoacyl-[acyl-carrier-protein] synthase II
VRDAGLNLEDVDYINAHGTSTMVGEQAECDAIRNLFGKHASSLMISSTKSMTGHLLGAAGGVEAIFTILGLHDGVVPPTINLDQPDPACEGLDLVPHEARQQPIKAALSNSFGFGGTNGSLLFTRLS